MSVSRRQFVLASTALAMAPKAGFAVAAREITWDDLIPIGVPYGEIIGEGERDAKQDTWLPVFDQNSFVLNPDLDGAYVRIPGYIIPFDQTIEGVTSFILVPYMGACIHTPPPPPNQLIFVESDKPWKQENIWDAIWVVGEISHGRQLTEVAETGYAMKANTIEIYEWE